MFALILALLAPVSVDVNLCLNEFNFVICDDNDPIDGYWWNNYWIPGLPTYQSQFLEMPMYFFGKAVFYAPWIMKSTADYRGLSLDGYLGGVALPMCSEIGTPVWLKRENHTWEGPYLVVDCARRNDLYGIIMVRGEAVEVDFDTALRWDMVKLHSDHSWNVLQWQESIEVSQLDPVCLSGKPIGLSGWFEDRVTYSIYMDISTVIYEPPTTWRFDYQWVTFPDGHKCKE